MKPKFSIILSLTTFVLCCAGCSDSFLEPENDPILSVPGLEIEDVKKAFSELPFKVGVNDFKLDVLYNKKWDFRLIIPAITDNESAPLFVNLHGGALTPNPDAHKWTECFVEPALENTKAYVLSPNSQGMLWNNPANESQVLNLIAFAIENLNIDSDKVVILGYSDGGTGSWFFADHHPEVFSAAIPMASAYGLSYTDLGLVKKTDIPLYVIHGSDDVIFPYTNTETWVEQSVNAGSEIILVEAVGLTHSVPCDYLPYLQDAIQWVKTEVWQ
tara:strand:+ start:2278 stop:3093 length:816 start_codon:yes stop_codon:yes gene_type:complete